MPTKTVVLTDAAQQTWTDEWQLSESADLKLPGSADWSLSKQTLHGGVSEGVEVVEMNNGLLSVSLLPTRGMGLWRGRYRNLELGWKSPVSLPVHPAFVNLEERKGLGWLGGFNELMCRCGLAFNGPPGLDIVHDEAGHASETPLTLHGKIANTPAHRVEAQVSTDGPGRLRVMGTVDETALFGPCLRLATTVETEAGSNRLVVTDDITNLAGQPAELELLYHTNFGPPFLEEGARFAAPAREVVPRDAVAGEGIDTWSVYDRPLPGYREQVFYLELAADANEETLVLLRNAAGDKGVSLHFSRRQLPCFALWKNTQSEADGYVTGLEPGINLPNLKTFERQQGRVISLPAGASCQTRFELAVHASATEVSAVEQQIGVLQGDSRPQVHRRPLSSDSPAEMLGNR